MVVRYSPIFQASIYPTKPGMIEIDWTIKPIWADEEAVRSRINEALANDAIAKQTRAGNGNGRLKGN